MDSQQQAAQAVFVKSNVDSAARENAAKVCGPTLQSSTTAAINSLGSVGFQATNFGKAVEVCNTLIRNRAVGKTIQQQLDDFERSLVSENTNENGKVTISEEEVSNAVSARKKELPPVVFLGIISTLFGTGVRDAVKFLCEHALVDVIVVSGGGLEHDIRRAVSSYVTVPNNNAQSGHARSPKGASSSTTPQNDQPTSSTGRFGNVVYDKNNNRFKSLMTSIVHRIAAELEEKKIAQTSLGGDLLKTKDKKHERGILDGLCPSWCISPREFWQRVGELLPSFLDKSEYEQTVTYWAAKNNIPIYCPSITDGDIMQFVFPSDVSCGASSAVSGSSEFLKWPKRFQVPNKSLHGGGGLSENNNNNNRPKPLLQFDLVKDIYAVNRVAMQAGHTGIIVCGGGVVKHHICNANLFRNGAEHAIYISNAQEFDGSDGGARPDEAVSWGKIKATAKPVKIYSEISLVFPLLVASSFAEHVYSTTKSTATKES